MQPTPTEAAQQEFDLQQAAFERARQKLAAARSGPSGALPAKSQPFNTVEQFFRLVNKPLKHSRLPELVLAADFQPAPRRSIPNELSSTMDAAAGEDPGLIHYWTDLTRDEVGRPNRWHFEPYDFKQSTIAVDLVMVSFQVKRVPHRPQRDLTVAALAVVPVTVLTSYLAVYVDALLAAATLGLLSQLPFIFLRRKDERVSLKFNVRKLLVRCGNQWRLFCGDWEAYEEADLSWLDQTPTASAPTARVLPRHWRSAPRTSPSHVPCFTSAFRARIARRFQTPFRHGPAGVIALSHGWRRDQTDRPC